MPAGVESMHALTAADALAALASSHDGLAPAEARVRLRAHGPNELPQPRPEPLLVLIARQFRSAIVLLLLAAIALSLLAGDHLDAIAIAAVLVLNAAVGVSMEVGAGRALRALRNLETPKALVVRDGVPSEIAAADLVPGDVIVLEEGALVPADGRLLESIELRINESLLTGESVVVAKDASAALDAHTPLAERRTMVYQGAAVAAGRGRAVVVATAAGTELGRIGALVERVRPRRTPLERRLDSLGRQLAVAALALAMAVIVVGLVRTVPLGTLLPLGIALAVATVPEGLPAVATIALAVGVRRMARRRALVRQLPVVEALGSVTVVCADKTGTLTAGAMTATAAWSGGRHITVTGAGFEPRGTFLLEGRPIDPTQDPALPALLRSSVLSARATVEDGNGIWRSVGDPTDAALVTLAGKAGMVRSVLLREEPLLWEIPFSSEHKLSASAHRRGGGVRVYVKGSPQIIADRCDSWQRGAAVACLTSEVRTGIQQANETLSTAGHRVIAVAFGEGTAERQLPAHLTFLGLVAMTDPPADGVAETIQALEAAGVRTVMITGDQRATGRAIAGQLGLNAAEAQSLDTRDLEMLDDESLARRLPSITVFSRVSPEDKLRIVEAFQRQGDLVAMLGDGVNDAAALRRADVGVAMGGRGTDVAREAADIVLEDDRFPTIIGALEQGRIIFDNLRKFVYYLVSCNLAEMLTIVAFPLTGTPLPFTPLQILWLNMITDTIPALALAVEPADPLVMRRPPRRPGHGILSRALLLSAAAHAVVIALSALLAFWLTRDSAQAGTVAFLTLAAAQVFHLANARSEHHVLHPRRMFSNRFALWAVLVSFGLIWATAYVSPLAGILSLERLAVSDWVVILLVGAVPAAVGQVWRATRKPVLAYQSS
jgi:Ca2+-transporting ATPase